MGIFDIFSKRQKRRRGEVPDVYVYDQIPKTLRVQVVHILKDAFGENYYSNETREVYKTIHDILAREYGTFSLSDEAEWNSPQYHTALFNFFLATNDTEKALDVIELSFRVRGNIEGNYNFKRYSKPRITAAEAVKELNQRFHEHGVGYQFESGQIVRIDSKYVHAEVAKPTLTVLSKKQYKGANDEFLKAHKHYRKGRYKECLNECLKAFESTMKAICDHRGWSYKNNYTASKLIKVCFDNNLIPAHLQSHFSALRSSLESGIPTVRNRHSGHGQGTEVKPVPRYLAGYLLHLTATTILFLSEAEESLP